MNYMSYEDISIKQLQFEYRNIDKLLEMVSNNMAQLFLRKQKTREYQKTQFKKTGVLDTQNLFNYKLSDDLFIRKQVDHVGKSYGFVVLLDMSGSMSEIYMPCAIQIILLSKFCRKIGVPFDVYGFIDSRCGYGVFNAPYEECRLLNFFSSRSTKADFEKHCKAFYYLAHNAVKGRRAMFGYSLGGTPLNNALYKSFKVIEDFSEMHKRDVNHLIVLTDGSPSDSALTAGEYKQVNVVKIGNRNYFYKPIEFLEKAKAENCANIIQHRHCGNAIEQFFWISTMRKHFGSKLKCHHLHIASSRRHREVGLNIETKKNKSELDYHTKTIISSDVFKCFGNSINSSSWFSDHESVHGESVNISREKTKIGKQMEKTLSKTKDLKVISEKIVELLVEV